MSDQIKEAFQKVKEDMLNLQSQVSTLTKEILELKRTLNNKTLPNYQTDRQTNQQTDQQITPTNAYIQTDKPTVPHEIEGSKTRFFGISIGNEGVQTDRQTNQQTDQQTAKSDKKNTREDNSHAFKQEFALPDVNIFPLSDKNKFQISSQAQKNEGISRVSQVLDSLDSLKQDLRKQFKRLTPQEMQIFSTIYSLSDQNINPDYSLLASKTNLSESSIRDYIQKLIKKGIPLYKTKENNKRVIVSIPSEFKRMSSLQTILQLRNL